MKVTRKLCAGLALAPALAVLGCLALAATSASGAEPAPALAGVSKPVSGDMQILFHGGTGPFTVQKRLSLDASSPWQDMPTAKVTQVNTGVFIALIPTGEEDAAFYRVVSAGETIVELKGWTLGLKVSAPANGTHFVAGEQPVVTVNILDNFAQGMNKTSFSSFALYMYGPEDPLKTVTAWKLLNASLNRSASVHHYIDLKTNAGVVTNGNALTYTLQPVTDEAPGTYTVAVRSVLSADGMQQIVKYATVQIGTSTVESKVVSTAKCAECHQGTVSGKLYMHHVDVSSRSPFGSWIYDLEPEKSCKMCHNNEGYAAFTSPETGLRVSDHIVIRAHGVHMGEGLKNYWNTNHDNGTFADYTPVVFPADVRNCTACHTDDRWKTKPSRLACGTCHDDIYFGGGDVPTNMVAHFIRPLVDDTGCVECHAPDNDAGQSIAEVHAVANPSVLAVELTMTPPANGQYYANGDAPQVTIKLKDRSTGLYVDPATVTSRLRFMVSGPRSGTLPVLTTAALDHTKSGSSSYIYNDLTRTTDPRATRTADSIIYQLDTITNLTAGTYNAVVYARRASSDPTDSALLNFQVGTATLELQIAGSCMDCHGTTGAHGGSYTYSLAPENCKSCHDYEHQLTGKTAWTGSGQSQYGFGVAPISRRVHGVHYGRYLHNPANNTSGISEIIFPMDVRNCTKCHSASPSWKEQPSRLACFSCHDSDDAIQHGNLMTYDPTPVDPWGGDEWETCTVCHGKGSSFAPDVVHAISNPYVPPYPREPAE